jgi:hypothetical protein
MVICSITSYINRTIRHYVTDGWEIIAGNCTKAAKLYRPDCKSFETEEKSAQKLKNCTYMDKNQEKSTIEMND